MKVGRKVYLQTQTALLMKNIRPFHDPEPNLGKYIANTVNGQSRYQEAIRMQQIVTAEYIIDNLKVRPSIEQVDAEVVDFLRKRSFTLENTDLVTVPNSLSRFYNHPEFMQTKWCVLINLPDSKRDISITLTQISK